MVRAMKTFMATEPALLGKVVDVFSNFHTIRLPPSREDIEADHRLFLDETSADGTDRGDERG